MAPSIIDLTTESSPAAPPPPRPIVTPAPPRPEELDPQLALEHAIKEVKEDTLRRVILRLCALQPAAAEYLRGELLVGEDEVKLYGDEDEEDEEDEDDVGVEDEEDEEDEEVEDDEVEADRAEARRVALEKRRAEMARKASRQQPPARVAGQKRVLPRYATCEQCEEEFDVTMNEEGDCVWHSGKISLFYRLSLLASIPFTRVVLVPTVGTRWPTLFQVNWNPMMTLEATMRLWKTTRKTPGTVSSCRRNIRNYTNGTSVKMHQTSQRGARRVIIDRRARKRELIGSLDTLIKLYCNCQHS